MPQNFKIHDKEVAYKVEMNHASFAAAIKRYKESMKEKEREMGNYLIDVLGLSAAQLRQLHIGLEANISNI